MKYLARVSLIIGTALLLILPAVGTLNADPLCGDVNSDGLGPNIADICYLVLYLFQGTPAIPNYRPAEIDGYYGVNVGDLTTLVTHVFMGAPAPDCVPVGVIDDGYGCLADSAAPRDEPASHVTSSGCTEQTDEERMWAELHGEDLYVFHYDVEYQCCLTYDVTFSVDGHDITATEHDLEPFPCPCLCYYNLKSVLSGLPIGEPFWVVTLIGIHGDTVGVDTLGIPFGNGTVELELVGNDLHVRHLDALANCCPGFFFDYYVQPGEILVVEWDSLYLCDCICRFNLESVVPSLDPGEYTVTVLGVCTYPYGGECDTAGVGQVVVPARSRPQAPPADL